MSEASERIADIRAEWGERLLILGHHYQRSSVIRHADERGDSLELSRKAAAHGEAERIVFCGVHFMAESADILAGPEQTVYMPETGAGCPMADMATVPGMESAWQVLQRHGGEWLPVVYVNSSAGIKACCGRWGGSTCTSSNAAAVFQWVFDRDRKVFFLPDEHLGVNTAHDLGVPADRVAVYDPGQPDGGLTPAQYERARVIVWKGFCLVHVAFTVRQVEQVRAAMPDAKIIVHPEAPCEVVRLADAHGSTSRIIRYVETAADGDTIVVGTELNLVQRLAEEHAGRVAVKALSPSVCANMAKINEQNLLALLQEWPADRVVHVNEDVAGDARLALERMLAV
jgi:quinolinate synthase